MRASPTTESLRAQHARAALGDVDTGTWTRRFDLLSDPHRLELLLCLHRAPDISVGELAVAVARTENSVSQALRILRQQHWVESTRTGRTVTYRLCDDIVHQILHSIGAAHQPTNAAADEQGP